MSARREPISPKKNLGQHFLQDSTVLSEIATVATQECDARFILEIGPGTGNLTQALLERKGTTPLYAIEKDRRAVEHLRAIYRPEQVQVVEGDAHKGVLDWLPEGPGIAVGNLPYNVGTGIFTRFLTLPHRFNRLVFMFQKEVAQRITAAPNDPNYGSLSVYGATWGQNRYLFDVPPEAFSPPPKVWSAVIESLPSGAPRFPLEGTPEAFERFVQRGFRHRRKTLAKSLSLSGFNKQDILDALKHVGLRETSRPQELGPEHWSQLYNCLESGRLIGDPSRDRTAASGEGR